MTVATRLGVDDQPLATWRAVLHERAAVRLDPAAEPVVAAGAAVIGEIVGRGAPVYGVNSGFG